MTEVLQKLGDISANLCCLQ